MTDWLKRFWPLLLLVAMPLLFLGFPAVDLWDSARFYSPPDGFLLAGLRGCVGDGPPHAARA